MEKRVTRVGLLPTVKVMAMKKSPKLLLGAFIISIALRKMRDSNPRYPEKGIPDFESSAFGHSANLP